MLPVLNYGYTQIHDFRLTPHFFHHAKIFYWISPKHRFGAGFLLSSVFFITLCSFFSSPLVGWDKCCKALPCTPKSISIVRTISWRTHIPYPILHVIHSSRCKNIGVYHETSMKPTKHHKAIQNSRSTKYETANGTRPRRRDLARRHG